MPINQQASVQPDQVVTVEGSAASGKKTYQRPRILFREPLEAMAANCATGKTDSINCSLGPIQS